MSEQEKWKPKELYDFWNGRYFRGSLPDLPVHWGHKEYSVYRKRYNLGGTHMVGNPLKPIKITLNPKYKNAFVIWAQTLLHEMVHVQQWRLPRRLAHGRKFQKRIKQLVAAGAYNGLL